MSVVGSDEHLLCLEGFCGKEFFVTEVESFGVLKSGLFRPYRCHKKFDCLASAAQTF